MSTLGKSEGGQPLVVYAAGSQTRHVGQVLREMAAGAWQGRFLAYRLFRRDLKAEFADSALGYLWNFVNPLVLALLFIFMKSGGILQTEAIEMPYGVYVVCGMLLFQSFIQSLNLPLTLLKRSGNLLNTAKVPPEALIGSTVIRLVFDSLFYIPIIVGVCLLMDEFTWAGMVYLIVLYPAILLLGCSIGLLLAPFNVVYNDFQKFVQNLTRPLLFICPTFYRSFDGLPWLNAVTQYNPIAIAMDNIRLMTVQQQWMNAEAFWLMAGVSLGVFLLASVLLHVSLPLLAQEVSG
jgi:lipopolysaccharide transport system permease protein